MYESVLSLEEVRMFGLGKMKSASFPLTITVNDVFYARKQSEIYLTFPHVGWFKTQFRTEWEATLDRTLAGENFLGNIRHRILHDYRDMAKVQTAMRDLEEARHMAYAISLVYAAIFSALGKRLPFLEIKMLSAYLAKRENLGLTAFSHFTDRLELFHGDLGYEVLVDINKSGTRSLGSTYAKAFIEILFNQIESLANEAEMNK